MPFFLLPHTCVERFSFCYLRGWGGERSESACTQRQRDSGAVAGRGQALAALAPNVHTFYIIWTVEALEITVQGTEFTFLCISHSNLPPQETTLLFSLPMQRDECFLWAKPVSMNIFCNYNRYIWKAAHCAWRWLLRVYLLSIIPTFPKKEVFNLHPSSPWHIQKTQLCKRTNPGTPPSPPHPIINANHNPRAKNVFPHL